MKTLTLLFCLLSFAVAAQTEQKWTTIISDNGDLSFSVPSNFLVYKDKERDQITLRAGLNDTSFLIYLGPVGYTQYKDDPPAKITRGVLGKFNITTYEFEKNTFDLAISLASSSHNYSLRISSKTQDDKTAQRFLQSISIGKSPLFKTAGIAPDPVQTSVSAKELKTSDLVAEILKRKQAGNSEIKLTSITDDNEIIDHNFYTRPLWILQKPKVPFTDEARQRNIQGKVVLLVEFKASGEVGYIKVIKGLAGGLTEQVARAVKQIKFLPAEIDEKAVDSFKVLEYSFSIY